MLKEREPILEKLSIAFQVILTLTCFWASLFITDTFLKPIAWNLEHYKIISVITILLWIFLLEHANLGRIGRINMFSVTFIEYFTVVVIGSLLLFASVVLFDFESISRLVLGVFAIINLIVLSSFKFILSGTMKYLRRSGVNTRQILIIADSDSNYFIDRLIQTKDWGYKIWAIMSDDQEILDKYKNDYKIISYERNLS